MNSKTLALSKLVATGNDFIFINALDPVIAEWPSISRPELAQTLCDRHFGIGADGLVFIEKSLDPLASHRLRWDFYNSDGSTAEMCGNATRCVGRWAERVLDRREVELETLVGMVNVHVRDKTVDSELAFASSQLEDFEFTVNGEVRRAVLANTGVPHAVVEVADLSDVKNDLATVRALRFHPITGARGANVTFLQKLAANQFRTLTFERGVENFTLSCGTGVLAAAAVGIRGTGLRTAKLETPGGMLEVHYDSAKSGATLSGPAEMTFQTKIDLGSSLFEKIYGAQL